MKPRSLFEILKNSSQSLPDQTIISRFLDLFLETEAPFSRDQFVPGHLTGSCFVVNPEKSKILLLHHRKLQKWLQMGGHCDGEANLEAVALREAQEETGSSSIRLLTSEVVDLDIHVIPPLKGDPSHLHYDVRFLAVCEESEHLDRSEEETLALKWFSWKEAFEVAKEPSMHRVFEKIIRF